ncbi:amidohydrolase [Nakamurella flavida]|uniref:Amidohydrolase n=1 Tax=Nakamurella flavida TaxID=363630 RepID=A0A938YPL6_9ACTN|nr:amidohydrolase [Nakamurella flavida]MBM9475964.1 amidohydrolase [Nakamurella flavida]MBM9478376.1 amidohydrolase [Nakamurella flavida]MDP9777747.1 5-methylthioadenosine/S-adenosylhomocysteine deaminase [Nakamurella flavida]
MTAETTSAAAATPQADLLISDVTALVHGPDGAVDFLPGAGIVVRDGLIETVAPMGELAGVRAARTIAGHGQVAMPGFINCHTHSPMVMFRGAAEDVSVVDWFNKKVWPMEVNLTPNDVELAARLACAEMIAAGVTTFADHYFSMDRVATAVDESGLRANLGWTFFSSEGPAGLARSADFAREYRGAAGGRITTALAPHGAYTVDDDDLRATARIAQDEDILVHIHAAESRAETRTSRGNRGLTPIGVLDHTGLLEGRVLIAHGRGVVQEDLPLLARAQGRVGVGSAPKGYLKNGTETTAVRSLVSAGVAVGLATDGAASNNTLDVWESLLFTCLVQKAVEEDELWMTARQGLHHATLQSAAAVGLAGQVGSLAPGHQADIILVDLSGPHTQPIHDLASTLVFSARSADISTTIVAGQVLMEGRRLLTVDVPAVAQALAPRLAALTDVSHGRSIQDYAAHP